MKKRIQKKHFKKAFAKSLMKEFGNELKRLNYIIYRKDEVIAKLKEENLGYVQCLHANQTQLEMFINKFIGEGEEVTITKTERESAKNFSFLFSKNGDDYILKKIALNDTKYSKELDK